MRRQIEREDNFDQGPRVCLIVSKEMYASNMRSHSNGFEIDQGTGEAQLISMLHF